MEKQREISHERNLSFSELCNKYFYTDPILREKGHFSQKSPPRKFYFSPLEYCINYCISCLSCGISVFPNPICSKRKNYRAAKSKQKVNCFLFHIKIGPGSWSKVFIEEFKRVSSLRFIQIYWDTIFTYA